jgi:hypothetical protein
MKKSHFTILLFTAALMSCSKPEKDKEPSSLNNPNPIVDLSVYQSTAKSAILTAVEFPAKEELCNLTKYDFIAGQTIDAGDIIVGNDKDSLYIEITSTNGFQNVSENVKMWIGATMPFTDRPVTGHFPFKYNVESGVTSIYLSFALTELGLKCDAPAFYLIIHGDVLAPNAETAFGGDIAGAGNAWWFYLTYAPKCCEPPVICTLSATATVSNVKCFGSSNGSIDLTILNGKLPYTYIWSNGITTEDLTNIPSGTYSVTITDANKCVAIVKDLSVLEPLTGIAAYSQVTNISIYGAKDGAIDVTTTGGTPPYTYEWNTGATTEDLGGLEPGIYSVVIKDANGCNINLKEILVEQPDEEKPKGEIAFARKTNPSMVFCFSNLDLDNNGMADFTDLGWTNGPVPLSWNTTRYGLYIGITDCDASNAIYVGQMTITSSFDGTISVKIEMNDGYTLNETRLYIGNDILPKDTNDKFTTDPKFYTHKHENLDKVSSDAYSISGLPSNIYVVGYALVNKPAK